MSKESTSQVLFVDDFYFSALIDEPEAVGEGNHDFQISDAKYAEGLQFQEAIMASMVTAQMLPTNTQSALHLTIQATPSSTATEPITASMEIGESSQSFCDVCVEKKEINDMFRNELCLHSFCSDCISKYVATKIQATTKIVPCPGLDCRGVLELDSCRAMVSREVVDRWDEMLCASLVPDSQKFYCPFKDCNAMLVNDGDGDVMVRESECPICHRLFCALCYVPWHPGIVCEEFQRLSEEERGREDLMVRELAREKKWMRCPYCKYYVEKTEGCLHMNCRCGHQFCYACGATWSDTHGGCQ